MIAFGRGRKAVSNRRTRPRRRGQRAPPVAVHVISFSGSPVRRSGRFSTGGGEDALRPHRGRSQLARSSLSCAATSQGVSSFASCSASSRRKLAAYGRTPRTSSAGRFNAQLLGITHRPAPTGQLGSDGRGSLLEARMWLVRFYWRLGDMTTAHREAGLIKPLAPLRSVSKRGGAISTPAGKPEECTTVGGCRAEPTGILFVQRRGIHWPMPWQDVGWAGPS